MLFNVFVICFLMYITYQIGSLRESLVQVAKAQMHLADVFDNFFSRIKKG